MILPLLALSGCGVDNYAEPSETLTGKLIDSDGEPLITEQPNGFLIRLYEEGSSTAYDFWGKPDGSFRNTKLFGGNYTVQPINGPFLEVDPVEVRISGVTNVDFVVTPLCKIDATIINDGGDVKATYTVTKAVGAGKIRDAILLVTKWNPNVGIYCRDWSANTNFIPVDDALIVGTEQTLTVADVLESGVTYYARVGVLCENTVGRYNLSPITKLVVD